MPRRQRQPPDTRIDWRDPDMPVLRPWQDSWTGRVTLKEFTPEEEQEWRQEVMREGLKNDRSDYNLAAETKRKRRERLERLMKK